MGLFDLLSPRKRKFNAAVTILLAEYTYARLSEEDSRRVDDMVTQALSDFGQPHSTLTYLAMPDTIRYGFIAGALKRLGIPPALPGESWSALTGNPFSFNEAEDADVMEEAYNYLSKKGFTR